MCLVLLDIKKDIWTLFGQLLRVFHDMIPRTDRQLFDAAWSTGPGGRHDPQDRQTDRQTSLRRCKVHPEQRCTAACPLSCGSEGGIPRQESLNPKP
jgi:hypothetical protein